MIEREGMPATTPEEIHRLFEDAFNAGDIDGLVALYEPDAAVIPQPGSVVQGTEQVRAGLQAFLALQGRVSLDTSWWSRSAISLSCPTPGR
jgi:ketosteroid isomerase-like protein